MAVIMAAAAAVGAMHMIVMVMLLVVRVVFMAAMLVVHMLFMAVFVRMLVCVIVAGCRGFARGCQSLFMQPLVACSVKG